MGLTSSYQIQKQKNNSYRKLGSLHGILKSLTFITMTLFDAGFYSIIYGICCIFQITIISVKISHQSHQFCTGQEMPLHDSGNVPEGFVRGCQ